MANKAIFLIFQGCWTDKIKSILRPQCNSYRALGCWFVKGHREVLVVFSAADHVFSFLHKCLKNWSSFLFLCKLIHHSLSSKQLILNNLTLVAVLISSWLLFSRCFLVTCFKEDCRKEQMAVDVSSRNLGFPEHTCCSSTDWISNFACTLPVGNHLPFWACPSVLPFLKCTVHYYYFAAYFFYPSSNGHILNSGKEQVNISLSFDDTNNVVAKPLRSKTCYGSVVWTF